MKVTYAYLSPTPTAYPMKLANLKLVNLLLKPKYLIDPLTIISHGQLNNRSLVKIEGLEDLVEKADIVGITDTYYPWCAQVAQLVSQMNKPLVTVLWETLLHHPASFTPPYCWYIKQVVSQTDLFILRSHTARRFAQTIHIPDRRAQVIYKGVDLHQFRPAGKPSSSTDPVTILYLGQLVKSKGINDLLAAFAVLSPQFPQVKLTVVGEGPLADQVIDASRHLPITYLGRVNYPQVPRIYQQADIFCSPSRDEKVLGIKVGEESFSYTLMEAQAAGLPIVTTNCGAIPEEVGQQNFLVDQGDHRGLTQALAKLIKDHRLRIRLAKANRARAEQLFDLHKQARETEQAMLSVLNHHL